MKIKVHAYIPMTTIIVMTSAHISHCLSALGQTYTYRAMPKANHYGITIQSYTIGYIESIYALKKSSIDDMRHDNG